MSEKMFALLLRLYPSRLRQAYGSEVLQLMRDRFRDERGVLRKVRFWLDLVIDLLMTVVRGYASARPELAGAPVRQVEGIPTFQILGGESPRRGALMAGILLSLITLVAFPASISRLGSPGMQSLRSAFGRSQAGAGSARESTAAAIHRTLDGRGQRELIQAVIARLKSHYADPAMAQALEDALMSHVENGDYDRVDGRDLASLVTSDLREVSHDPHLGLVFSETPLPDLGAEPAADAMARYRDVMRESNCTFEKAELRANGIGYVKLNSFPDLAVCRDTTLAAMAAVNRAKALIIDLRDNRGGYPAMVMLIAAHLFDHPQYIYNPKMNTARDSWTTPVAGNGLARTQVYVLISPRTASAAEQLCYNLKMLRRATLVGEKTSGNAHAAVFHRINGHYGVSIREVTPINPYGTRDWEGTGVEPDIAVPSSHALSIVLERLQAVPPRVR